MFSILKSYQFLFSLRNLHQAPGHPFLTRHVRQMRQCDRPHQGKYEAVAALIGVHMVASNHVLVYYTQKYWAITLFVAFRDTVLVFIP